MKDQPISSKQVVLILGLLIAISNPRFNQIAFGTKGTPIGQGFHFCNLRTSAQRNDPPNRGVAPNKIGEVGRLDLRVLDENGNPVAGAYALFKSKQLVGRKKGAFCESWNWTDSRGVAVLPPLQIGEIRIMVDAKGFRKFHRLLQPNELALPVTVRLVRK